MKEQIQRLGRFLSGMVMPNIGAFIAWGLITACFIPTGWIPNETFNKLVGPMLTYLLPLMIGFTGGKMIYDHRGGVVGAIATIGVIVGSDIPMFLGAMLVGPLGGWVIKKFDELIDGKVKQGFEMLVNNFSAGILGGILALIAFVAIGPVCQAINIFLGEGAKFFADRGLLPLMSIFVEPAKILFLNNAINHGVFTPLGAAQVAETGKSLFFMIESNPGTGLGMLCAYWLAGKGTAKSSAPGAIIIHFFGGIHEIYFPYVLMNPILLIAMIGGSFVNILVLTLLGGGLVAPASPGSIFAELIMTAPGSYFANIAAITLSAVTSFVLSVLLLKTFAKGEDLGDAIIQRDTLKAESKGGGISLGNADIKTIVFACDAGMGSSAMGETMLKKKLKAAGLEGIKVVHSSIDQLSGNPDIILVHEQLKGRVESRCPKSRIIAVTDLIAAPQYDQLIAELAKKN
ncbi:MAG: PTS mannitol transporter subunit IICBA [Elusimicrobiota bacterium]|jgi:PTS system mannitol-specific IIC component|nr:PTS mannitol transporter subunit IICBA [Elusimicrobiota bacterium]